MKTQRFLRACTWTSVGTLCLATAAHADVLELISPNPQTGGFFGTSVSAVGDVTGDGVTDVIVGASNEDAGAVDSGRAYVINGATGAVIRTHASPNPVASGIFGNCVAGIPDISGDGVPDYAIGARGELNSAGRVYVYSGATGALLRTHLSPNSAAFGRFGDSIAGIPDLTQDGRGDYIIGAPDEDSQKGRAYVYSGSNGTLWRTHTSANAEVGGKFGYSVAAVPDLNNDGSGDYVIGAPYEGPGASPSGAGRAYVFSGLTGGPAFTLKSPNEQGSGFFGWSVGGVPDANGDGKGDIVVGAPYESMTISSTFYNAAGRAYLFSGASGTSTHTYREADADVGQDHNFGYAVDGMFDRTGDNLGEIIVGVPGPYVVYVYKGTGAFDVVDTQQSPDNTGINQFYGSAVAGVKDANGDGKGDYIVGGPGSDNFPTDLSQNGRAWIHRSTLNNNGCSALFVLTLNDGPNDVTNIGATGNFIDTTTCANRIGSDVWFTHTTSCDGDVIFSTCGASTFDTVIAVYPGCSYFGSPFFSCVVTNSSPINCNDDTNGCANLSSRVSVPCLAGECFFVRLGGYQGAQGVATLTVTCSCTGDLNADGIVDGTDLGLLLGNWGSPGTADLDSNGSTDGTDLGLLLGNWGPCS